MSNLAEMIGTALAGLKEFEIAAPTYVGLEERVAQTKAAVEATQQELEKLKAELAHAQTSLAQTQASNVRRHTAEIDAKYSSQRENEIEIGNLNTKLSSLEAQIREKQAQHHSIMLGLDGLKSRLNVT